MTRTLALLFAASLIAACSGDDGSKDPIEIDLGTSVSDMGSAAVDMGDETSDTGGSTDPDTGGSTDPDTGMTTNPDPDMGMAGGDDMGAEPDMMMSPGVYVGTGDPYMPGDLTVSTSDIAANGDLPVDVIVMAPEEPGSYPVIVFQHGFVLQNSYYTTMLEHVASHGFVIVAPQMYTSGVFGAPSTEEEAADARLVYDWTIANIDSEVAVDVDTSLFGLAGHSRGGKVLYTAIEDGFTGAVAAAGIDPVDGGGGFGTQTNVTDGGLMTATSNLIIGTELGLEEVFAMACAPAGRNHETFYGAAPSPAYWAFGEGYGHLDMLNDQTPNCGFTCGACVDGPEDGQFRVFAAGQLVAFFRMELQGDATAEGYITGAQQPPITAQFMNK